MNKKYTLLSGVKSITSVTHSVVRANFNNRQWLVALSKCSISQNCLASMRAMPFPVTHLPNSFISTTESEKTVRFWINLTLIKLVLRDQITVRLHNLFRLLFPLQAVNKSNLYPPFHLILVKFVIKLMIVLFVHKWLKNNEFLNVCMIVLYF